MSRPSSDHVDEEAVNGSSCTRSGPTRHVVKLLFLTCVGTLTSPQIPAVASPNQAVLLDGATDASSVFYVAFTSDGLQFSVQIPPDPCPDTEHVPQAGVFQASPPITAIFHPDGFDGRGFVVWPPSVPGALPPNLQNLIDDCDIVEHFAEVSAYLDQAYLEATDLAGDVDACVQDARTAYCHLVEAIENAEAQPNYNTLHFEPPFVENGMGPSDGFYGGADPPECAEFLVILESVPQAIDSIEHNLSTCEMKVSRMNTKAAGILASGHFHGTREGHLAAADGSMSQAEELSTQANEILSEINQVTAQFDLSGVELSCEECDGSPPPDPLIPLSGAVTMQTDRDVLDRYVTAFYDAASDTDDPDLAARLSDIAFRLEEIPDGRVHHLTFTSTSAIEQDFLALHAVDADDDGESPLAVLLTAVNPSPPLPSLPPMNAADERLLFDGFEAFLTRVSGATQSIPAVSVWSLVAMALLVLTAGTVVYARRSPTQT